MSRSHPKTQTELYWIYECKQFAVAQRKTVNLLLFFCWRCPGLINELKHWIKVSYIKLPIIWAETKIKHRTKFEILWRSSILTTKATKQNNWQPAQNSSSFFQQDCRNIISLFQQQPSRQRVALRPPTQLLVHRHTLVLAALELTCQLL